MNREESIEKAKELRRDDKLEESQDLLLKLLEAFPNDPMVLFETGGSYDVMGLEPEAIPYYRQAIEQGLKGEALYECLICLGSSQRLVGDSDDAVDTLEEAAEQFPENDGAKAFLALAYYSNDQCEEAVSLLLDLLVRTSSSSEIRDYAGALEYYKDHLDEFWEE